MVKTLAEQLKNLINADRRAQAKRLQKIDEIRKSLENPMQSLNDDVRFICEKEGEYYGTPITYSISDAVGFETKYTCDSVLERAKVNKDINLCVEISRYKEHAVKSGQNAGKLMCFLTLEDSTGRLDSAIIFPSDYTQENKVFIYKGSLVLATGQVSKDRKTFIVRELTQV